MIRLCFTEERLCGIIFNVEIADILKWQSIITPTYGSNLALVIAVVSINWGLEGVMACRADGPWISTTFHSFLTQSFHYQAHWFNFVTAFQFFIYIKCLGDKLLPELFLGSLHSISLLYLKYASGTTSKTRISKVTQSVGLKMLIYNALILRKDMRCKTSPSNFNTNVSLICHCKGSKHCTSNGNMISKDCRANSKC